MLYLLFHNGTSSLILGLTENQWLNFTVVKARKHTIAKKKVSGTHSNQFFVP